MASCLAPAAGAQTPRTVKCIEHSQHYGNAATLQLFLTDAQNELAKDTPNYDNAIQRLEGAASAADLKLKAFDLLGQTYLQRAERTERSARVPDLRLAQACFAEAAKAAGGESEAAEHYGQGKAYLRLNEALGAGAVGWKKPPLNSAIDELETATASSSAQAVWFFELGHAHVARAATVSGAARSDELRKADAAFTAGLDPSRPPPPEAERGRALVAESSVKGELGGSGDALPMLEQALKIAPSVQTANQAGLAYLERGDQKAALNAFRIATTAPEASGGAGGATLARASAYYNLSVLETVYGLGDIKNAVDDADKGGASPDRRRMACLARIKRASAEQGDLTADNVCLAEGTAVSPSEAQLLKGMYYMRRAMRLYDRSEASGLSNSNKAFGVAEAAFQDGADNFPESSKQLPLGWPGSQGTLFEALRNGQRLARSCVPPGGATPDPAWVGFFASYGVKCPR
jgi:tetratricopeptide (TPR) repeat protein